jgi:sn-glycerol 3-phosphate transport system ATP-binding protein
MVVVMNGGRIEQTGAPTQVYRLPATRFVATFIGSPAMNLIPGKVTGPGMVEVGGGQLGFVADAFDIAAGREVEVGIRPEDLRFGGGEGAMPFAKDFVEELGATRLFHGTSAGTPLVVAVAAAEAEDAGSSVTAEPQVVHLFDPATGNSLRRA